LRDTPAHGAGADHTHCFKLETHCCDLASIVNGL
jgi:hypothetical protein